MKFRQPITDNAPRSGAVLLSFPESRPRCSIDFSCSSGTRRAAAEVIVEHIIELVIES
jgi:hypothetical protein